MKKINCSRILPVFTFIALLCTAIIVFNGTAYAKYCGTCGSYNSDINQECIKCKTPFPSTSQYSLKVGVVFFSYMYPDAKARYTVYYKGSVTPFFVWNPKGPYEIGESRLPVEEDLEFISLHAETLPDAAQIRDFFTKYELDRVLLIYFSSEKIDRFPILTSETHNLHLDARVYNSDGTLLREKRYNAELKAWPNPGVLYIADTVNALWDQMVNDIHLLLSK